MHAAADITFSLLTSVFVLSPSPFFPWIQFVLSVQFVLWVWLLLDRSWLATVRDVTGEVGSSSQILASTSIRPGTTNKQPRSAIWLYFKDVTWTGRNTVLHCTDLYTHNWDQQCNTKARKEQILPQNTATCSGGGQWRTVLTPQPTCQKVSLHSRYLRTYLLKGYF